MAEGRLFRPHLGPAGSGEFGIWPKPSTAWWRKSPPGRPNATAPAEALRDSQQRLREINATLEDRIAAALAERERSEAALRQAHRLQAVGQLTGGIAHDSTIC